MNTYNKLKYLGLDLLSFGSPQAIVFNLFFILLFLIITPTSYVVNFPQLCVFRNFILPLIFRGNCPSTGIFANCEGPACGLTRSVSNLLHGNFKSAWEFNRLSFVVLGMIITILIVNLTKTIKYYRENKKIYSFD